MLEFPVFRDLNISGREHSFLAETFRAVYSHINLTVSEISGRNTVIRFVGIYETVGYNYNKTPIILYTRPERTYIFGVRHTSLCFTLRIESEVKSN